MPNDRQLTETRYSLEFREHKRQLREDVRSFRAILSAYGNDDLAAQALEAEQYLTAALTSLERIAKTAGVRVASEVARGAQLRTGVAR